MLVSPDTVLVKVSLEDIKVLTEVAHLGPITLDVEEITREVGQRTLKDLCVQGGVEAWVSATHNIPRSRASCVLYVVPWISLSSIPMKLGILCVALTHASTPPCTQRSFSVRCPTSRVISSTSSVIGPRWATSVSTLISSRLTLTRTVSGLTSMCHPLANLLWRL